MPFAKRHEEIVKKIEPESKTNLWIRTILFSIVIFIIGGLYLYLRRGEFDLHIANKVFAITSLFLIGFSLSLSALCYFWNFLDTKIVYRKHLGVIGFAYALLHALTTFILLREEFPWPDWYSTEIISVLLGLAALIIFSGLAAISNRFSIMELGGRTWRRLLRYGGYTGFILVIIHFGLLKYKGWGRWFSSYDPWMPPLSLIAIIFVSLVLMLRLALAIALFRKKSNEASEDE
ncbi:hypothetical protein IID19_04515 [Patescibacteria group bacterium]|nr:hypothetical protein [Patescibacteria group bacterium]